MKKIGEILKKERENRGLSLHEIGMSLKINPKILKAIEDGDEKNLPAKTFLRGFVRSYAQYLRLDVEQISQMFQEEVGSTRPPEGDASASPLVPPQESQQVAAPISPVPQEPKTTKAAQPEKPLRRPADESLNPSSSNRMMTIVGAIVLVLLIAFVAKMVEKYQKEAAHPEEQAVVTTTTVPSATATPEATATPNISEPAGAAAAAGGLSVATTLPKSAEVMSSTPEKMAATTTSTLKPTTTTVRPTTTTVKAVVAARVSTTTTSTSSTTVKKTTTTVKVTTTTVKNATTSTTSTTVPGKKTVEVIVEALNNVTIKYTLGDDAAQTLEMAADQVHTFKGKGKIVLEVTDGGAVSVIVNGRDRGVPGTIGQPIKLSYP